MCKWHNLIEFDREQIMIARMLGCSQPALISIYQTSPRNDQWGSGKVGLLTRLKLVPSWKLTGSL